MKSIYKVNKNSQLTIIKDRDILKPRGNFAVSNNNQLTYEVKEPADWRRERGIPKRIILKGKWSIDANHNLIFTLQKTETQSHNERLLFKSELVQAKANALIFSLGTQGRAGTHGLRLLQLKGKWQADKYNRLQFLVKKIQSTSDVLTFQGSWQVKNNTLVYTYKKISLKTKVKHIHTLRFKGYWEVNKRNRLSYILDTKNNSSFVFKTYLETPSLIGKRGAIKYRVGIGFRGSKLFKTEIITLYGVWKLHRRAGLSFDADYGDDRIKAIRFSSFMKINKKNKVTLKLRSKQKKDLGMSVKFSRTFLKNEAEWFLRAVDQNKHPRFEWGITIPW